MPVCLCNSDIPLLRHYILSRVSGSPASLPTCCNRAFHPRNLENVVSNHCVCAESVLNNASHMNSPTIEKWESLSRDPLLSVAQIKTAFGFDSSTIRRWVKTKSLRGLRVGGQLRFRTSEVLRLMKELENENA
jgi:excisionase family DNA binding protein